MVTSSRVYFDSPEEYSQALGEKFVELFSEEGDLRWLYLAMTRRIPAPYVLSENPTLLQIMAMNKVSEMYAIDVENNSR